MGTNMEQYDFTSAMDSARKQLAEGMVARKELLIKAAISHKLGRTDWILSDVKGRGEFIITPDKIEKFVFDGMEMVVFYPPAFSLDGSAISSRQNYRILY